MRGSAATRREGTGASVREGRGSTRARRSTGTERAAAGRAAGARCSPIRRCLCSRSDGIRRLARAAGEERKNRRTPRARAWAPRNAIRGARAVRLHSHQVAGSQTFGRGALCDAWVLPGLPRGPIGIVLIQTHPLPPAASTLGVEAYEDSFRHLGVRRGNSVRLFRATFNPGPLGFGLHAERRGHVQLSGRLSWDRHV
jgi:hypothetical protein